MLFEKLTGIEERYNELSELMAQPEVVANLPLLQQYAREQSDLEAVVGAFRTYRKTLESLEETQALLNDGLDPEMRELAQEEMEALRQQRDVLEEDIKLLLLPRDVNDTRDVICEIRQGEGGDEAALFAADLFRMYQRYADDAGGKSNS
jgi:peptide chain release factor 1